MILHWLAAGMIGLTGPVIAAASEPPPVTLVPAPPLPEPYPDHAEALPEPDYPQPPVHIAQRISREGTIYDGFRTGELEYLRGFFPDASVAERAQYAALKAWVK